MHSAESFLLSPTLWDSSVKEEKVAKRIKNIFFLTKGELDHIQVSM